MYKAILIDIYSETTGVYKVFDVWGYDVEILRRQHRGKVSGSNGTYTVYDEAETKTYIVLRIPELDTIVKIDVRQTLLALTGRQKLTDKFYVDFKKNSSYFSIDQYGGKWRLIDPSELREVCKKMKALKK